MYRYYQPLLYCLVGLAVVGALAGLYYWNRFQQQKKRKAGKPAPSGKAA